MKLSGKNWSPTLAGEYVLGTLSRPARLRFKQELGADAHLREMVERWEQQFAPLLLSVGPERPSRQVWERIMSQISGNQEQAKWWQRVNFWRPVAILSSAAALLLAVYLGVAERGVDVGSRQIALMQDPGTEPSFILSFDSKARQLKVQVLKAPPLSDDQSLELWMLPKNNQSPVSLGLLPLSGEKSIALKPEQVAVLSSASGLAISLEPKGGSTTGLPTGPVLYQGKMQTL